MPQITINGKPMEFQKGQTILQVALANEEEIPHYCYHDSLSIPANCRICLAEIWQPNPKTGKLESTGRLSPTCHTHAAEGMVVYTDSDKAKANQKAVMEYLLINHPVVSQHSQPLRVAAHGCTVATAVLAEGDADSCC